MLFREGQQRPIIIGSIDSDNERQMLERMLAAQNMTLADVEVISIEQAEGRGLFENQAFLRMIRQMGFNNADEMRAAAQRMRRNGMMGNAAGGNGGGNAGGNMGGGNQGRNDLPERPNNGGAIKFGQW